MGGGKGGLLLKREFDTLDADKREPAGGPTGSYIKSGGASSREGRMLRGSAHGGRPGRLGYPMRRPAQRSQRLSPLRRAKGVKGQEKERFYDQNCTVHSLC